jgi:hypothetical protein
MIFSNFFFKLCFLWFRYGAGAGTVNRQNSEPEHVKSRNRNRKNSYASATLISWSLASAWFSNGIIKVNYLRGAKLRIWVVLEGCIWVQKVTHGGTLYPQGMNPGQIRNQDLLSRIHICFRILFLDIFLNPTYLYYY